MELSKDCRSLFDMICVGESGKDPSEATLTFPVDFLRQDSRILYMLRAVYGIDTRDSVADGLTKGTVARAAIMELLRNSRWSLNYACQRYSMINGRVTLKPISVP